MTLHRYSVLGRSGSAQRRATAPADFLDDDGKPIPGTIPRLRPKPKPQGRVKAGKDWSAGRKGPCGVCAPMRRRRPRQAHHVLPQRAIRDYVVELRLPLPDGRKLLKKLLTDKRNRMWLCVDCHAGYEHGNLTIYREMTPVSAWDFARELGERYVARLERMYPTRSDGA